MVKSIGAGRFWSIYDVRRYRNVDFDLYLENGAICKAYQTQHILKYIFLSGIGYIQAFYKLNFRIRTIRELQI